MIERILKIIEEQKITSYKIEKGTNNHISSVAARKILIGETTKPRRATLDILIDFLCAKYNVSREWLNDGTGDMYLKDEADYYIEKQGVRFELEELIAHFIDNQEMYLEKSDTIRLLIIDNIVKNKDFYLKSEYFKLFVDDLVEKRIEVRLQELKDLGVIVKASKKD
ncbi:hypothetical protein EZY14_012900 [Kordia sp. TARA_039_SRF]|nr:hypothetical protein EZY14_012900 [Kordia sp. TARA_039_SRF]